MKRFVYVPHFLLSNNSPIPEEAKLLAKDAQLSIREGSLGDGILKENVCIISIPEFASADFDRNVAAGRIFSVDITNEFVDIDKSVKMEIVAPSGLKTEHKPSLLERHVVKFRARFTDVGKHEVSVFDRNEKFLCSSFEVL